MAETNNAQQAAEYEVETLTERIASLEHQINTLQKELKNKNQQFNNLLGLYNLLAEKIITSGTTQ